MNYTFEVMDIRLAIAITSSFLGVVASDSAEISNLFI